MLQERGSQARQAFVPSQHPLLHFIMYLLHRFEYRVAKTINRLSARLAESLKNPGRHADAATSISR
jgi:hypothetical protein